jgi:hypothetical protein
MREADCDEDGTVDRAVALRNIARAIGERNMATTGTCYRRSWARMRGVMAGVWRKIVLVAGSRNHREAERSAAMTVSLNMLLHVSAPSSHHVAITSNMVLHHLHRELLTSSSIIAEFKTMHLRLLS